MAAFVCNVLVFTAAEVDGDAARAGDVFQAGIAIPAIIGAGNPDNPIAAIIVNAGRV